MLKQIKKLYQNRHDKINSQQHTRGFGDAMALYYLKGKTLNDILLKTPYKNPHYESGMRHAYTVLINQENESIKPMYKGQKMSSEAELKAMHEQIEKIWSGAVNHINADILHRYLDEQQEEIHRLKMLSEGRRPDGSFIPAEPITHKQ